MKAKESNKKALEDQMKNTKEKGEIEVLKNKMNLSNKVINTAEKYYKLV